MVGTTRGIATLLGAAVAGFLLWLAAQIGTETAGDYWATYGLVIAAGLPMALSQVLGGWTKWGWPRLSPGVFLLGFLPVAVVGLWLLFSRQPGDPGLDTAAWSDNLGVDGVVRDLGELLPAVAFMIGLTLGFVVDTSGPRLRPAPGQPIERPVEQPAETTAAPRDEEPTVVEEQSAADEPLTAERRADVARDEDPVDGNPSRRVIRP
jgi:hypothetical protein